MEEFCVEVRDLRKRYDEHSPFVVDGITFGVKRGELLVLLGPSGCGKTTTMRCIAGLEDASDGDISINGVAASRGNRTILPPERRQIGMVFQSYAVWPHMTVFENVAFPLRLRKVPKAEVKQRVEETLNLVGLSGLEHRGVTRLSGGQQQRVAVARALVFNPQLLLFDEPLSNLDLKLREHMRVELRGLIKRLGLTAIYVTHDQEEAMTIADRLIVMNKGRIAQEGDAQTLYAKPVDPFVANFVGVTNLIEGRLVVDGDGAWVDCGEGLRLPGRLTTPFDAEKPACLSIRPEAIRVHAPSEAPANGCIEGEVQAVFYLGDRNECQVRVGPIELRIKLPTSIGTRVGDRVVLEIPRDQALIFPSENATTTTDEEESA